jgi:hypothetical protein
MPDNTPAERARGAWIAPLIATVLTLPACLIAYFFAGLAPMACDSCTDTQSDRFDSSYGTAFPLLQTGLGAALLLLLLTWALPWEPRNTARKAGLALAAIFMAPLALLVFYAMVDWPSA